MIIAGIESGRLGSDNQTRGIILEATENEPVPVTRNQLIKDIDGKILHLNNYENAVKFHKAVFCALDDYYKTLKKENLPFPEYFAIAFDHGAKKEDEAKANDMLAGYIKEFAKLKGLKTKTIILTAGVYDYKNIDLIHVGRHQITKEDEELLKEKPYLKNKMIITDGVPSNLNWVNIEMQANSPLKALEFAKYKGKKVALFSLGGKTANGAISFTVEDAKKLLEGAKKLKKQGYEVIFTNSPRTPNEVSDFLYENCKNDGFSFYNSKRITDNAQEAIDCFTIYHGKYNEEFKKQAERVGGNIYPAVLSLCRKDGFVLNTWDSFSYTSDVAVLGITSVVYDGNKIDTSKRPDCKKLLEICKQNGYIKIFDDDFIKLDDKSKKTTPMKVVNKVIVEEMQNRTQNLALEKKLSCFLTRGDRR